jgi:hypothetical protein
MAILEPKAQIVKNAHDYKAIEFKLKLDGINMVDKMEFHKQICEMVFRDLLHTSSSMGSIQAMDSKIEK